MDISKQTINTSQHAQLRSDSNAHPDKAITELHNLRLEAGKTYTATVVKANTSPEKIAPTNKDTTEQKQLPKNTPTLEAKEGKEAKDTKSVIVNNSSPSDLATDKKQTPQANKEWLILVKGKLALISSEKPLESGQKLLLKLDSSTPNKPTLLAQLVDNKPQPASQTSVTSPISNPVINKAANLGLLNASQTQSLLQALNLSMDKQLPLRQGLSQLDALLKSALPASNQLNSSPTGSKSTGSAQTSATLTNTSQLSPADVRVLESIKGTLIDSLPKSHELIQASSNTANGAKVNVQAIKQGMLDSGLFLEKSLQSQPEKLAAFKELITRIDTRLNPNNTAGPTNSSPTNSSPANLANSNAAINKIQQTIESLLQLASNQKIQSSPSTQTESSTAGTKDLKANLISLASLLNKHLADKLSEAELKSIFLGSLHDEALVSPFSFPLMAANQKNASKALFDKQEFSTGQILKLLAGMIHKLQFNQLHSLLQSNNGNDSPLQQTWFFELPVLSPDQSIQSFNFRIDQEEKHQNPQQDSSEKELHWKLLLSFDLEGLGPIYVQVTLSSNSISSVLWASNESTLKLLKSEAEHFKQQLEQLGLNVDDVRCQHGQPQTTQTKLDRHLVDTTV